MARVGSNKKTVSDAGRSKADAVKLTPQQATFIAGLKAEERMLLLLKTELYDGQWEPMIRDLQDRLNGRPYIFKLASRITDDLARIERLRAFEDEQKLDLASVVPLEP
jgi:hypothetical protein